MQADPRPHSYTRPPCAVCGTGARLAHKHWCGACQQAYLDKENARTYAEWLSTQSYAAPRATPIPQQAPGRPPGPCPRCAVSLWVDRGNGQWSCGSCGYDPELPTGLPAGVHAGVPSREVTCAICGPTTWVIREDDSQACARCGAVRG